MSASKVKNMILGILILVNIFLLILVVPSRLAAHRQSQKATQLLEELFLKSGIQLDVEKMPASRPLYDQSLSLRSQSQKDAVTALLGGDTTVQEDAGILYFTANTGSATLEGGRLSAQCRIPTEDPKAFTQACLERMEVPFDTVTVQTENNVTLLACSLSLEDLPVSAEDLIFQYEDGYLTRVTGPLLTKDLALTRSGVQRCITARDALVEFLGSRMNTGWMGSSITAAQQIWILNHTADNENYSLRPAWRITTDVGTFLVDGINRSVTLSS